MTKIRHFSNHASTIIFSACFLSPVNEPLSSDHLSFAHDSCSVLSVFLSQATILPSNLDLSQQDLRIDLRTSSSILPFTSAIFPSQELAHSLHR